MGARKLFVFSTHFSYWNMGSFNKFLSQKLGRFFAVFWFSVSTYLLPLFGFISTYFSRLERKDNPLKCKYSSSLCDQKDKIGYNYLKTGPEKGSEKDDIDHRESESDGLCETETTEFCFKFKFPTYEEFCRIRRDNGDFVSSEAMPSTSTTKYEFLPKKNFISFIEELEPISCKVEEVNPELNGGSSVNRESDTAEEYLSDKDEAKAVHEETYLNSVNGVNGKELSKKNDAITFTRVDDGHNLHFSDGNESSSMNSDMESVSSSYSPSDMSPLVDSYAERFLSDVDFGGAFELDHLMDIDGENVESHGEMSELDESQESDDFDGEDSDIMEELRNFENDHIQSNFLSVKDFHEESDKFKYGEINGKNENFEIPELKNSSVLDSEDTNKLESLWEHQDLIEQLKMELKKVKATGLPTIMEESESPKIMENLKPWKIDEKFQHENPMGELHKFYKSYRDRMRKFDILSYQKMYAIGFLQLKDPQLSISSQKTLVQDIASILSDNLHLYKSKKYETDPTKKFVDELISDLEVVYVGQMCLSWEVLHWQYGMALDLWESDPRGIRRYNEVAGEFQQFQVLIQRFLEDEPFQGPRLQNYIKHRCVFRNLLQVPVIREDIKKAKRSERGDYSITSDMLVEIVEESIRLFWRFVRADKDCSNSKFRSRKGLVVDLQDPADSEILKEVRKDLQKKEKKLKEQMRSENCILKKFQTCREDDDNSDHVLFFFSQVDMKLVSRVLNMSKLTADQLGWCRNKLNTVSFINRKIHVDPSFCLFPC